MGQVRNGLRTDGVDEGDLPRLAGSVFSLDGAGVEFTGTARGIGVAALTGCTEAVAEAGLFAGVGGGSPRSVASWT